MIKYSKFTLILLFILVNFVQSETISSIPQLINYQGMLTNAEGQPLETKEYKLSFSIFNQPIGGEAVWGPQIFDGRYGEGRGAKVPVVRGHFNVILGDKDINGRLITDAFQSNDTYLEISVENNNPISPRQKILTAPYAIVSETVKGPDLFVNSENGCVAIGSKTPKASLYIKHSETNDIPSIMISNPSPEIILETESSHYNWRIAAQVDIDSGLEISSGNKDADASDDSSSDWKNLFVIKREENTANVMVNGHMSITEQPRCRVTMQKNTDPIGGLVNTWQPLLWDNEEYDIGDCWAKDKANLFIAPVDGLYLLQGIIYSSVADNDAAYFNVYYVNGTEKKYIAYYRPEYGPDNFYVGVANINIQYYMKKNASLGIEVLHSDSRNCVYGNVPDQHHKIFSFVAFAKIQ